MGWIILAVLVALVLIVIGMYNSLVRLRAACESGWAEIDVQLKRRYDLIPNLDETVKVLSSQLTSLGHAVSLFLPSKSC